MRRRDLIVYSVIVMATILLAETAARIWMWRAPAATDNAGDTLGTERYGFNFDGPSDLVARQDGHWVIWWRRPYHVETNSQGFRTAEEPIDGARKIVVIGDSQTFGPYVASEDTWSAWTQSELRRRPDAKLVQVFNAGVSGYTIYDELAWLRDKGVPFKPDLIVLGVFENDVFDYRRVLTGNATRISGAVAGGGPSEWIARLRIALWQNSALYNIASAIKRAALLQASGINLRRGEGDAALVHPDSGAETARYVAAYEGDFRAFAQTAVAAGIPVAVVSIPSYDSIVADVRPTTAPVARRLSAEFGFPFLDLEPVFAAIPDAGQALYLLQWDAKKGLLEGNGHLSRFGHLTAGRAVAGWLAALPSPHGIAAR